MDRKEKCERVILSQNEKKLLRDIKRHPHKKCDKTEVWNLYTLNLVEPDTEGEDAFHQPIPKDTYCVSDFYWIYHEYRRDLFMDKLLTAFWLPMNCTPFVRQYGILSNKWGVFLCQKEYQTNDIRRNSKNW